MPRSKEIDPAPTLMHVTTTTGKDMLSTKAEEYAALALKTPEDELATPQHVYRAAAYGLRMIVQCSPRRLTYVDVQVNITTRLRGRKLTRDEKAEAMQLILREVIPIQNAEKQDLARANNKADPRLRTPA